MIITPETRAVLFDLDGTLLDHDAARDAALLSMVSGAQELTTEQELHYLQSWRENSELLYERYLAGELTFEQQRLHRILRFSEVAGLEVTNDDDAWAPFGQYQRSYELNWRAFDDVAPTLARLRDLEIPIAVVTNGPEAQQNAKVTRLGLGGVPVIASGGLGFSKPDPRIFDFACQAVGQPAAGCLMVGDNPAADVIGAQEAGLGAVLLNRHRNTGDAHAHLPVITTLHDLFKQPPGVEWKL